MIISGLSNSESDALITLFPELKEKAIMKPLVDANQILTNCDLTICHGGSGTVYQSLIANTPVLCFPHNPDQGLVALAVKEGNWGSVVLPSQSNSDFIYQTIINMLNDSKIIQAVNQFSKKLIAHDTKNQWLAFLSKINFDTIEAKIPEEVK
jgi:UDP:flavonoid glycosyltransferase YjiC (YdhE family)